MSGKEMNRRQIEALIKCGALDSLGETRSTMLSACELLINAAQQKARSNLEGQLDFFSDAAAPIPRAEYPSLPEFSKKERIAFEREYIGLCFSGHPLDEYSEAVASTAHTDIGALRSAVDESGEIIDPAFREKMRLKLLGVITARTEKATRTGGKMAFITLEDRFGEIEVIVFPKQYQQYASLLLAEHAVAVEGELSVREGEAPKLLLSSAAMLLPNGSATSEPAREPQKLYLRVPDMRGDTFSRLRALLDAAPQGRTQVILFDTETGKYAAYTERSVRADEELCARFAALLGEGSVVLR
jgi:DNA polymerase-3 subunit alpha